MHTMKLGSIGMYHNTKPVFSFIAFVLMSHYGMRPFHCGSHDWLWPLTPVSGTVTFYKRRSNTQDEQQLGFAAWTGRPWRRVAAGLPGRRGYLGARQQHVCILCPGWKAFLLTPGTEKTPVSSTLSMDMHDICKRAAAKLNIPWPTVAPNQISLRGEEIVQDQTSCKPGFCHMEGELPQQQKSRVRRPLTLRSWRSRGCSACHPWNHQ